MGRKAAKVNLRGWRVRSGRTLVRRQLSLGSWHSVSRLTDSMRCSDRHEQWPSGKRCLTTDRWRSAYAAFKLRNRYPPKRRFIQELTFIIKQDIANINKQIASLQAYLKQRNAQHSKSPANKQIDEHNANVVMLLQSKLATTSMSFKDVLEVRTQVSLHCAAEICSRTK